MMQVLAEPVPLSKDADGVLRIGGTRVPLETVVHAFESGATPEEISQDFPVLDLADVYATVTYYLRHRNEVAEYLERRATEAEAIRRKVEARSPANANLRERLMARLR